MMEHLCWTAELQLREGDNQQRIFSCHEGKNKMSGISEHFNGAEAKTREMLEKRNALMSWENKVYWSNTG